MLCGASALSRRHVHVLNSALHDNTKPHLLNTPTSTLLVLKARLDVLSGSPAHIISASSVGRLCFGALRFIRSLVLGELFVVTVVIKHQTDATTSQRTMTGFLIIRTIST